MRDEIDGRLWVEHGAAFGETVAAFFRQVAMSLGRLHEIQYDAPRRAAKAGLTLVRGSSGLEAGRAAVPPPVQLIAQPSLFHYRIPAPPRRA